MLKLKLDLEARKTLVSEIQAYFAKERSETLGELAAGEVLDFMIQQLGPVLYNQAIRDARVVVMQQMERVEEEVFALEQPIFRGAR